MSKKKYVEGYKILTARNQAKLSHNDFRIYIAIGISFRRLGFLV